MKLLGEREIEEIGRRIGSTIDVIGTRKEWRYSPVVAAVPVVVAEGRPSNRKTPSLPGNGASRIGCEKASPADSLGSEYRRCDFTKVESGRIRFSPT